MYWHAVLPFTRDLRKQTVQQQKVPLYVLPPLPFFFFFVLLVCCRELNSTFWQSLKCRASLSVKVSHFHFVN